MGEAGKPYREPEASLIRSLVETYYDVQKRRVATFNQIVAWVKNNADEIRQACLDAGKRARVWKP